MPVIKSTGFPIQEKQKIDQFESNTPQLQFLPVPGPKGDIGPQGPMGPQGIQGTKGDKGDKGEPGLNGKDGRNGKDGKDGISNSPVYSQQMGWASYINNSILPITINPSKGQDGWHNLFIDRKNIEKNHKYLPNKCDSLYDEQLKSFNFRGLNIGSIVKITYDLEVEIYTNNTELWIATIYQELQKSKLSLAGYFKYSNIYNITLDHTFFIEDRSMIFNSCKTYAKSDYPCSITMKSVYISVS